MLSQEYIDNMVKFVNSMKMKKMAMMYFASKLTETELNELRELFMRIDANGDGYISSDELYRAMVTSKPGSEQKLDFIVSGLDFNKNGLIDYIEFISASLRKSNIANVGLIRSAFMFFDKDNDGCITANEIKEVMSMHSGFDTRIASLIAEADLNHDGNIDFVEFLNLLSFHNSTPS